MYSKLKNKNSVKYASVTHSICQTILDPHINDVIPDYEQISPIIQLDGSNSPPPPTHPSNNLLTVPSSSSVPTCSAVQAPTFRIRSASYTLDRPKQVRKLVKDTMGNDFTIEVNKNKQNVNITCNSGFYATVAVPAIQQLAASQELVCQGIDIHCRDIVGNFDASRAQQNTVVQFRLSQDKISLGGVRIHLHHTSRLVQLQGGVISSDGVTAPVWFVNNILQKQFNQLSKEKSVDISEFNTAVQNMASGMINNTSHPVCAGCNVQFDGRSSPEFCTVCKSSYHKYKCYASRLHACYQKRRA